MEFRLTILCSFLLLYNIPLQQCVYPFLFCCTFGLFLIFSYNKYCDKILVHVFGEHVHVFLFGIYLGVESLKDRVCGQL